MVYRIIILLLIAVNCNAQYGLLIPYVRQRDASPYNVIFGAWGESNSGGTALNSSANLSEIGIQDRNYIWDNINNDGVEVLNIGQNSLLGHYNINPPNDTLWHGYELETARWVQSDSFDIKYGYHCKTGQGGSTVSQWDSSGTYHQAFRRRLGGLQTYLNSINNKPTYIYFFASIGINDALAHTDAQVVYDSLVIFTTRMRTEFGDIKFYFTEIMTYDQYFIDINDTIAAFCTNYDYATYIPTAGVELKNAYHWSYLGFKSFIPTMLGYIKQDLLTK